ncbi:CDP-3,6-dideoxy-D-glycero-L-glycero-4-hexulose-4-reductase [Planctomyces sp. SCGC AG-212-M04]|nr:CDP-3,6-dideoxy-D-glycero-L-glycero-4-hexulose-4-reductase [Planctomyces sp. SCGC AG-212-M04]
MAKVISIHSFRGGTGKSNLTANLAAQLARRNFRVGVIDTDIQSPGIHVIFALKPASVTLALNDYLWGRCKVEEAAYDVTAAAVGRIEETQDRPRLFLIPSSVSTGEIARILREGYDIGRLNDGMQELIRALRLDYLLIDTHPGVNEETLLSIAVSDVLLLVMRPDHQDFQGTAVTAQLARQLDVRDMHIVLNKVPTEMDRDALRSQVEDGYRAPVAAMLPLSTQMAQLASSGLFSLRFPDHPLTQSLYPIVDLLVK